MNPTSIDVLLLLFVASISMGGMCSLCYRSPFPLVDSTIRCEYQPTPIKICNYFNDEAAV